MAPGWLSRFSPILTAPFSRESKGVAEWLWHASDRRDFKRTNASHALLICSPRIHLWHALPSGICGEEGKEWDEVRRRPHFSDIAPATTRKRKTHDLFGNISVIWSFGKHFPYMKFQIYGHFGYKVNFTRTKPWAIYPELSVLLR